MLLASSPDLPSLSEVFGRLKQATLSDSSTAPSPSTDALPSSDKSTFATYMGSNRGGQGCGGQGCGGQGRGGRGQRGDQRGRGSEQSGRDRGRGLCKCT